MVAPFFHDLERRVKLRHEDEATELCKGIVLGLYRAEQRGFELFEYAEDARPNLPAMRLRLATSTTQLRFRVHFIETFTPEWDWLGR